MDSFFRLLIAIIVLAGAAPAFAAFPAPLVINGYRIGQGGPGNYPTTQAACDAAATNFSNATGAINNTFAVPNSTQAAANCLVSNPSPVMNYGIYYNPAPPACPSGSTLSGSNCICTAPLVQNNANNACYTADDDVCADAALLDSVAFGRRGMKVPGSVGSGPVCWPAEGTSPGKGCTVNFNREITYTKPDGSQVSDGTYSYPGDSIAKGNSCTDGGTDTPDDDDCHGGQSGVVNGIAVCVPFPPSTPTETTSTKETQKPSPDGPVAETSTSVTTCTGAGSCTTTTTTTTSVNGGPATTSTATTTQGKAEHCAANKDAAECGRVGPGGSGFGGTCKEGFVGTGDALQKATAEAVNKTNCLLDSGDTLDGVIDALGAGTFGEDLENTDRAIGEFDQSNPLGASCPSDMTISIMSSSVTIPLSQVCWALQALGYIAVAFTLLYSTIFVVKGF